MRKLIFILAFLVVKNLFCNPVIPPPVISEFFLNEGNWQMEVYFAEEYYGLFNDFSDLRLVSNTDTAYFVNGLPLLWDSLMVIDQSSLTSGLYMSPEEDFIYFEMNYGNDDWGLIGEGIQYGYAPFKWSTTPPGPNESIAVQYFNAMDDDDFYGQLKQSPPSIGTAVFEVSTRCSFSGYVFDQNQNPVSEVVFRYCNEGYCYGWVYPEYACFQTDENGYFETDGLFCNWHFFKLEKDDFIFTYDTMFIEPDSVYYKEYTLNSVGVSDNDIAKEISIQLAPNPFTHKTSFRISIPDYYRWNEAEISIRNMNGQLVDVIHIPNAVWSGDDFSIDWYPARAATNVYPGLYLYTLEVDGKYVSSNKMIINE